MGCKIPFHAGELQHLISVEEKQTPDDGAGGQDVSWVERFELMCKIRQMSGREMKLYDQLNAVQTVVFETWWNDDVAESNRIKFRDEYYNIRYVENIEMKDRWMKMIAEKGVIN